MLGLKQMVCHPNVSPIATRLLLRDTQYTFKRTQNFDMYPYSFTAVGLCVE